MLIQQPTVCLSVTLADAANAVATSWDPMRLLVDDWKDGGDFTRLAPDGMGQVVEPDSQWADPLEEDVQTAEAIPLAFGMEPSFNLENLNIPVLHGHPELGSQQLPMQNEQHLTGNDIMPFYSVPGIWNYAPGPAPVPFAAVTARPMLPAPSSADSLSAIFALPTTFSSFQPPSDAPYAPAPVHAPYKPQKHVKLTKKQVALLRARVASFGSMGKWQEIAAGIPGRDHGSCSAKWLQLNRRNVTGDWSQVEDEIIRLAGTRGQGDDQENEIDWREVAKQLPLRSMMQCKTRWLEKLDPTH
ncbi:hypothetical protein BDK51DRAFT_40486 [Blyttiomyces helicus]|uniref:Homeodomain-like protein n=1 Tax=Blyttiomyces helicus TaxID=388810 RepID=A0A4P9W6E0_9FUNG|nr:hypothetical protein BDK51DRAFT_40486 [Blyttiomyces helicus]|eukprot:RKO87874.1 hypothetical protein BDK51DRAFT_40486 [Blyttiomyces helicus]